MSVSEWDTAARAISHKSSGAWSASRQRSSGARFSFPQDCDRDHRIAREGFLHMRQCVPMKLNSIRTRSLQVITGMALGMAVSTPNVTHATDQLAWDKTFPQSDKVIHQKVSFHNRLGINLVADLYVPKNLDRSKKHPAIVVGGPYGAVKEQSSGLYAQTMAERGFVTIAHDPSYNGESGGQPHFTASFEALLEDFSAAVDFLSTKSFVDRERIGVIGIIFSEHAFKKASEPKELFVVLNAGHVDLYDRVEVIPWKKLTAFFTEHLK